MRSKYWPMHTSKTHVTLYNAYFMPISCWHHYCLYTLMDQSQYIKKINEIKKNIINHPLFHMRFNNEQLSHFMSIHVYAVWSFMSIVKSLQKNLTPQSIPWTPNHSTQNGMARFINEIIYTEESDEISKNTYLSHFEIYILAMRIIGVNTKPILSIVSHFKKNNYSRKYINSLNIPICAKHFINHDISIAKSRSLPKIVGVFCFGKETIIPFMFKQIIKAIPKRGNSVLISYFDRHIEIDGERHGPLAKKIFSEVCKKKSASTLAYLTAIEALKLRESMWDDIYTNLENK